MSKVSDFTSLTGAGVDTAADVLPIVDDSETGTARNKKITVAELLGLVTADNEAIDDRVAALLTAGTNVTLTYDDGAGTLTIDAAGGGGGAAVLDDLTDVDTTGLADGDVLTYDSGSGDWVAAAAGGSTPTETFIIACSDESTAITTGPAKVTFRMPYAFTLTAVRASVTTAPTGSTILIDINESGTTILSTKLMIDASEKTSTTAATAAVISDSALADDAEITIDFDQVGSTIAGAGVKVYLIGHQ